MKKIALIGNPNVGKSTLFNSLTKLHQHTGNWPGKTVESAKGYFKYNNEEYELIDLPGTYSLVPHSLEETVSSEFICFSKCYITVIVCDALCLERNLNLVLQIMEVKKNVIVCINLMDQASKKNIKIDLKRLSNILGVPVVGTSATKKNGLNDLLKAIDTFNPQSNIFSLKYNLKIEKEIEKIILKIKDNIKDLNPRWVAINLINQNKYNLNVIDKYLKNNFLNNLNFDIENLQDDIVKTVVDISERISKEVVLNNDNKNHLADRIVTSKIFGIPLMVILLMIVLWITIKGANYPSSLLFDLFKKIEIYLIELLNLIKLPKLIISFLISGVYQVLTWVVAVMLPPMAIFFPFFTLLEDLGYLPRIAFNLDKMFNKCKSCGKQALTMCMGFGCNAVGVSGARIIDSPRERLIAILTNSFVPCNGRFPTMIAIITIFLVGLNGSSLASTLILTLVILLGFLITFIVSNILSRTILKGMPSSFILELPPYRKPQIKKVLIRSLLDRTICVLFRAVIVAIPAGIVIWFLSNITVDNLSLLSHISNFVDPFAKIIGLDGVILLAFILGFPANEIVIPIMIMMYTANNQLTDFSSLASLQNLLVLNGWTIKTALCTIIFSLCHFPCSTTCLTIKKETGKLKWMNYAILIPTIIGIILCFIINNLFLIFK